MCIKYTVHKSLVHFSFIHTLRPIIWGEGSSQRHNKVHLYVETAYEGRGRENKIHIINGLHLSLEFKSF
jgi:hypothetical protein